MVYFNKKQDRAERVGKVAGDIFSGLVILAFSVVYFGVIGGFLAFVLLYSAIVAVDYLMPNEDDAPGAAVR